MSNDLSLISPRPVLLAVWVTRGSSAGISPFVPGRWKDEKLRGVRLSVPCRSAHFRIFHIFSHSLSLSLSPIYQSINFIPWRQKGQLAVHCHSARFRIFHIFSCSLPLSLSPTNQSSIFIPWRQKDERAGSCSLSQCSFPPLSYVFMFFITFSQ